MSELNENKRIFRPVYGEEDKILELTPTNGFVYFATDSRKIYLGEDNEFIPMSSSKGYFYGNKDIILDDSGAEQESEVLFSLEDEDIEGDRLPELDDLILNIDGCFYRVIEVREDEQTVLTTRLTLQGSGTGGSGSGGGGGTTGTNFRITASGGTKVFPAEAKSISLTFQASDTLDETNYIEVIECAWDSDFTDVFVLMDNLNYPLSSEKRTFEVDITSQLSKFNTYTEKAVYLRVTDKYGTQRSNKASPYKVKLANLQITTTMADLFSVATDSFDYVCKLSSGAGFDTRTITYTLYNEQDISVYVQEKELTSSETSTTKTIDLSDIQHGTYTLKVQLTGTIGTAKVESNILTHKLLRYQDSVAQPIFAVMIPEEIQQYAVTTITYLMVYGNNSKEYSMELKVDGTTETTQLIANNQLTTYDLTFDKQGTYTLEFEMKDLGISHTEIITVTKYTGSLPVIDTERDDLKVYLTAKGRTNNATDKEVWTNSRPIGGEGRLEDFYFRSVNGWMKDADNVDYLKISQGAKFIFDAYTPFSNPATTGYTIELDFTLKGILDYNENLIECVSRYNDGSIKTGFTVSGDKFRYYVNGTQVDEEGNISYFSTFDLVENKRMRISFVIENKSDTWPLCYTYLNGLCSGIQSYLPEAFDGFSNYSSDPAYLKVDSTAGEVDLYNVRFYNAALPASMILSNYQASLPSLTEREESYTENLITDSLTEDIDLGLIEAQNESGILQIPYVKITGGYPSDKNFKMAAKTENSVAALPTQKKDYRAIDIEVHYPKGNSYFADYEDFTMTSTYDDPSLNVTNAFGQTAITGAMMYAQGTSSLEYPVKNLRVKLKGDKIRVRPDISPVNLICFKADYMESAGANNTGSANYIDASYDALGIQTPGQREFTDETIITCIKGHPCIIFWSQTGEEGSYKFIGKYNLNLDKATPEVFGFKYNEDDGFGYHENGDTYHDENGDEQVATGDDKVNSIYCFEFLDNGVAVCNFMSSSDVTGDSETEKYQKTWYDDIDTTDGPMPGWTAGFESRYPEDKEGTHDADALFPLASWINELYDLRVIQGKEEEALKRFKNEYENFFDKDFLLCYYLITEMLLMIDSRVKNMMLATWGKKKWDSTQKKYVKTDNYIWYPIFYDMDTMLGLDNVGKPNKFWYDEDLSEKGDQVFNGQCVLWNFVRDALSTELTKEFSLLESSGIHPFTADTILPYFNQNQSDVANEMIYNEDAEYKYTRPYRTGWTNDKTGDQISAGSANYLYAEQGNRSMAREYFVNNRVKYLRGKRKSDNFKNSDRIKFRVTNFDKPAEGESFTSEMEKIYASIAEVPSNGEYTIEAFKPGYIGIKMGANLDPVVKKYTNTTTTNNFSIDSSLATGTECQLLGMSNVSDLGDLSDKYIYNFIAEINDGDNRLKKLKLGNHFQHYYNPMWKNDDGLSLAGYNYLEDFNMENCSTYTKSLSFTDCPQIKRIVIAGNNCSTLVLPANGVLEELRLPTTVRSISIDSHSTLTDGSNEYGEPGFTIGYFDYDTNKYVNDFSKIDVLNINNTPGINTYDIVKVALENNLDKYSLQGVNWTAIEADDFEIENGEIVGIKVLDGLINKSPYGEITVAESLTGSLVVDVTASGNYTIDEFVMYQKYHKIFPDLDITYKSSGLKPASFIKFYSSETVVGDPQYSVLTNGTENLAFLTSINGPNGTILSTPLKPQTNDTVYEFSGFWKVAEAAINSGMTVGDLISQDDFANYTPTGAVSFVATYNSSKREYYITLYDDDGSTKLLDKAVLYWNDDIGTSLDGNGRLTYNYKDYSDENNPYIQYQFTGWRSAADYAAGANTPTWESLKGKAVTSDFIAYATYSLKDVRQNPLKREFFEDNLKNGVLTLKSKYINLLQGIINIPAVAGATSIKGFGSSEGGAAITGVIFESGSSYTTIGYDAFYKCTKLTSIDLPSTVTILDTNAFNKCTNLVDIDISNITVFKDSCFYQCSNLACTELNENTTTFGLSSFFECKNLQISKLPLKVSIVPGSCFYGCSKITINNFGDEEGSALTELGSHAFHSAGSSVSKMIVGRGVTTILISCFQNFGKQSSVEEFAYFRNSDDAYSNNYTNMGFVKTPIYSYQDEWVD